MRLAFFSAGLPVTKGSHRAFATKRGRVVVLPASDRSARGRLATWEATVRNAALAARSKCPAGWPTTGPVVLCVTFFLPAPKRRRHVLPITKPDVDKLARALGDALTGVVYLDDAQVVEWRAMKRYADTHAGAYPPGVRVEVEPPT